MPESVMKAGMSLGPTLSRLGRIAGVVALVGVAAELAVGFIDSDLSRPEGRLRLITAAAWLTGPLLGGLALIAVGSYLSGNRSIQTRASWLLFGIALLSLSPVVVLLLNANLLFAAPATPESIRVKIQVFGGAGFFAMLSIVLALAGRRLLRLRDNP